jgi:tRNA(fMet)-specific endonuclease VapC
MSKAAATILLDSDILSAILRRREPAYQYLKAYEIDHDELALSAMTKYEILRGLTSKNATTQIINFKHFCDRNKLYPIDYAVLEQAVLIYADLHRRGQLIGDGDIFIAATALVHGLTLATHNLKHFDRIPGLRIERWMTY